DGADSPGARPPVRRAEHPMEQARCHPPALSATPLVTAGPQGAGARAPMPEWQQWLLDADGLPALEAAIRAIVATMPGVARVRLERTPCADGTASGDRLLLPLPASAAAVVVEPLPGA